jgi:hypothetical protein
MDKIKMVFFEKRKSISLGTTVIKSRGNNNNNGATSNDTSNNGNNRRSRQRPLSYPNLLQSTMAEPQGETSRRPLFPLSHTLSRQSHMDTFSFRRRQSTMVES